MYSVGICDDDKELCSQLENITLGHLKKKYIQHQIEVFYSGADMYMELERGAYFDLIFLDIEMEKLSGIELGDKIRNEFNHDYANIVYISSYNKYVLDLFRSRPINFLYKPFATEQICDSIEDSIKLTRKNPYLFSYKVRHMEKRIRIDCILYFESIGRQIKIHVADGEGELFYGKLKSVHGELEQYSFLFSHRSFLVNFNHVEAIKRDEIILSNKERLPVSKTFRIAIENKRKGN